MKSEEAKKLCMDLIHADAEEEVVKILKDRGLWDDPRTGATMATMSSIGTGLLPVPRTGT